MAYKTGTYQKRLDVLDGVMTTIRTQSMAAISNMGARDVPVSHLLGLLRFLLYARGQIGDVKDRSEERRVGKECRL